MSTGSATPPRAFADEDPSEPAKERAYAIADKEGEYGDEAQQQSLAKIISYKYTVTRKFHSVNSLNGVHRISNHGSQTVHRRKNWCVKPGFRVLQSCIHHGS